jgi:hypothetical protein
LRARESGATVPYSKPARRNSCIPGETIPGGLPESSRYRFRYWVCAHRWRDWHPIVVTVKQTFNQVATTGTTQSHSLHRFECRLRRQETRPLGKPYIATCDGRRRCAETGVPWCAFLFAIKFSKQTMQFDQFCARESGKSSAQKAGRNLLEANVYAGTHFRQRDFYYSSVLHASGTLQQQPLLQSVQQPAHESRVDA